MGDTKLKCYFCGELEPAPDEWLCYRCKAHICDNCEQTEMMGHGHSPEDHREPEKS